MGAGNPIIRSYDQELYSPNTYYIDFTAMFTKEDYDKEYPNENNDSESYRDFLYNNHLSFMVDDFATNLYYEPFTFEKPQEEYKDYHVLAQTDNALLVVCSSSDYYHCPIGIVPRFSLEEIEEEVHDDNIDKQDWYEARDKDFDAMVEKKAIIEYNKRLKKFLKENEPNMRSIYDYVDGNISGRTGPWTSLSLKTIGKNYKFL